MSSFVQEWAQLKSGPAGQGGMRLAGADDGNGGNGGGKGDVQPSRAAWTPAVGGEGK
ncbi:hypothetical protein [Streptomyces crystallinus]|uniref:Uncharacterized protein n=1 Tax=Streptomyces crystallinus TaxID=68191 RepID=A0ABN1GSG5_9ACTN